MKICKKLIFLLIAVFLIATTGCMSYTAHVLPSENAPKNGTSYSPPCRFYLVNVFGENNYEVDNVDDIRSKLAQKYPHIFSTSMTDAVPVCFTITYKGHTSPWWAAPVHIIMAGPAVYSGGLVPMYMHRTHAYDFTVNVENLSYKDTIHVKQGEAVAMGLLGGILGTHNLLLDFDEADWYAKNKEITGIHSNLTAPGVLERFATAVQQLDSRALQELYWEKYEERVDLLKE